VLGGVKALAIHDPGAVATADLGTQYFLREEDIGKPRDASTAPRLAELNPYVPVTVLEGELSAEVLGGFRVVVCADVPLEEQLRISDATHAAGGCFIAAEAPGLFAHIFCDFGPEFEVIDKDGEQVKVVSVASITADADGIVTCLDETRHGLETGDMVTFAEVKGMDGLNGCEPRAVTVKGPYSFAIGDTAGLGEYVSGGIATQAKVPSTHSFKSLRESMAEPEFVFTDWLKFDKPPQLHVAMQAVHGFTADTGAAPRPGNAEDAPRSSAAPPSLPEPAPTSTRSSSRSWRPRPPGRWCPCARSPAGSPRRR